MRRMIIGRRRPRRRERQRQRKTDRETETLRELIERHQTTRLEGRFEEKARGMARNRDRAQHPHIHTSHRTDSHNHAPLARPMGGTTLAASNHTGFLNIPDAMALLTCWNVLYLLLYAMAKEVRSLSLLPKPARKASCLSGKPTFFDIRVQSS